MKVVIHRENFLNAFTLAASVAPAKSPKPVLQGVKLEVSSDKVTVMATDLELGIRVGVSDCQIESPGSIILPVDRMGKILREMTDERLELQYDGRQILVQGGQGKFNLPSIPAEEFPSIWSFDSEDYYTLSSQLLQELIRRTVYATDTQNSRYALGGVLLEFEEGAMIGVGTDGRRLAKQQVVIEKAGGPKGDDSATIVPTKAMTLLARSLKEDDTPVKLFTRGNALFAESGDVTIHAQLVEGRFPRWRDVFPSVSGVQLIDIPIGPFHSAVRQAAIVTSKEHRGVEFVFESGKVTMAGHGAEHGESRVELPVPYEGERVDVNLFPQFLIDFLRVLDQEESFTFQITGPETAVVCTFGEGYGYVIMPLAKDNA